MKPTNETSPDELLDTFKGRGLKTSLLFTLVIHAVILIGTSIPFLWGRIAGPDTETVSEEERSKAAIKEATRTLRKIADKHGIKPQDLSSSLAGGAPRPAPTPPPETDASEPPAATGDDPEEPKSAIEQELEKVEEGPEVPPIPEDDEVDLFR